MSRLLRPLALTIVAVAATVAALLWFAGSETALRLAARQAETASSGRLQLTGVQGSLYGPLRIERLHYQDADIRLELSGFALDWSPRALLDRELRIDTLTAQTLHVTELQPGPPPALPASLRLPVALSLPHIRLERLILSDARQSWTFEHLAFTLAKPATSYRLEGTLATPWGQGRLDGELAESSPFALKARARLDQPERWTVTAQAVGTLARLGLMLEAQAGPGQAQARLELAPFELRPLLAAEISAQGLDPARFRADWPRAALDAALTLKRHPLRGHTGQVRLSNALPGRWDRARLPLRELSAHLDGEVESVLLNDLRLDLDEAGRLSGRGRIEAERLSLELNTSDLNPRGLHGRLHALRLAGALRLQAATESQTLIADLSDRNFRLHLDTSHQAGVLTLHALTLAAHAGRLGLYGQVSLDEERHFDLAGALEGFEPSALGDFPPARLNASLTARGRLAPTPELRLLFAIADSHFRQQPLAGQGLLDLEPKRLRHGDLVLQLASNQLSLRGAFGAPTDQLTFRLDADRLGLIHPRLAGQVQASGSLAGTLAAPAATVALSAHGLRWGEAQRLDELHGRGRLERGLGGPLALQARLSGLSVPGLVLEHAELQAEGTREAHTLQVAARGPGLDLSTRLQGGWLAGAGWRGELAALQNRGRLPVDLQGPASLEARPNVIRLGTARLEVAGAQVELRETLWGQDRFKSQGSLRGLNAATIAALAGLDEAAKGDLALAGEWHIDLGERAGGRAAFWRERGDLWLPADPALPLELTDLRLELTVLDARVDGRLKVQGRQLGQLQAQGHTVLSRRAGRWGLAGDAPLELDAALAVRSLAWLAPWLDRSGGLILDGRLDGRLRAEGRLTRPSLSGRLEAADLRLALPEQGLDLREGRVLAELRDDTLDLRQLSLRGGDGRLHGSGQLARRGELPEARLALVADRLTVLSRPDRLLILSGSGSAALSQGALNLAARLKAERGLFELSGEDAPRPSSDVVVIGRESTPQRRLPRRLRLELELDLGERFTLKGRGLDAQLGGQLRLTSLDAGLPRASGSLRTLRGSYSAYGQRLEIERGVLNFQGPIDNPGLNIVALRKNQPVAAGVAVSGTVQAPRVKLVAEPNVPDGEKLSWLVLGRGLDQASAQDYGLLQAAAAALLAAGDSVPLQQRLAHAAGLEEISLRGAGTLEGTVLTLGKRLSSRAYLSYEHALAGTEALVKLHYSLSQRLSLRAQAGTSPALDLFYTFSFD